MKTRNFLLTAGLIVLLSGSSAGERRAGPAKQPHAVVEAREVIDLLRQGDFRKLSEQLAPEMRDQLPASRVEAFWQALVQELGALVSVGAPTVLAEGEYRTVVLPLRFDRGELVACVTYDGHGRVAGVYFGPKS